MADQPGNGPAGGAQSVTVRLVDLEPVAGLIAAAGRFCAHLDAKAYEALPQPATDALGQIQAILWRLEHAKPEE